MWLSNELSTGKIACTTLEMSKATVSGDSTPSDASAPGPSQSAASRGGSSNSGPSRIVGSQAKKKEVTRQGTQKMKSVVSQHPVCFTNAGFTDLSLHFLCDGRSQSALLPWLLKYFLSDNATHRVEVKQAC